MSEAQTSPFESYNPPPLRSPEVYQELLDPNHQLPTVTLKEQERGEKVGWSIFNIQDEAGVFVGKILLNDTNSRERGTAYIVDIHRIEERKNEKLGRSAYLELVKQLAAKSIRLISGTSLSRDTHKMWEWMTENGAARLVQERGVNEAAKNLNYTTSRYEII